MADAGCSGSRPFKGLINHQDHDRSLPSLTTRPSASPSTFRGSSASGPDYGRYQSFIGGDGAWSSTPLPTLTATAMPRSDMRYGLRAYPSSMTAAIQNQRPSFPSHDGPQYLQSNGPHPQEGWTEEYLRHSSTGPAMKKDHTGYQPGAASANGLFPHAPPPSLASGAYNAPKMPYTDHSFQMLGQPFMAPGYTAEMGEWMGAHRPPGVDIQDVDQVLEQISGELEELVVEAGSGAGLQGTTIQAGVVEPQSLADLQPTKTDHSSADPEPSSVGPSNQSTVSDLAKKILQAVDHEDGEKWKESSFLALMRDFRDGRKDVAGDRIREVAATE